MRVFGIWFYYELEGISKGQLTGGETVYAFQIQY